MSITNLILNILLPGKPFSYRQLSENGTRPQKYSYQASIAKIKEQSLRRTLTRLRSKGLVENKNKLWKITEQGKKYLKINSNTLKHVNFKTTSRVKNMIIIFDIPESLKKKRNWLRSELISLGFSLLQKSVWFGPSPLPKEFIKCLNDLNLLEYIKFFKAEEKDLA